MKYLIYVAAAGMLLKSGARASEPEPQMQVSFTSAGSDIWNIAWDGVSGRTYFIQWSLDLLNWGYAPVMEYGPTPDFVGMQTEGAEKYFVRLKYVDYDWVDSLESAQLADFDGDGIPNLFEITSNFEMDPFDKNSAGGDSNENGIADGYELYHFGALGVFGLGDDPDGDGLINQTEILLGMNGDAGFEEGASDKWEIFLPD